MQRQLVIGNKNLSSWSLRPWLALTKSGLPFDEVLVRLDEPGSRQNLQRYSPAGKVPVLIEDGAVIWDSLAIIEFIAESVPTLWPAERSERALARSLAAEMHSGFMALRSAMPMNCCASGIKVEIGADVQRDIDRIQTIWSDCRERFGLRGPWLFGSFSAADAMFAPVVTRFQTYGVEVSAPVRQYMQTVLNDPDMQRWFAGAQDEVKGRAV